jgi:hypothetical protein
MGFISILLGLIDPISKITNKIIDLRIQQANATTQQQKIAADEEVSKLQMQRDVLVAESGSKINAIIRILFAFPCAVYINKLILIDKIFGWGSTDDLSNNLWWIVFTVIGFYFVQSIASIIKR